MNRPEHPHPDCAECGAYLGRRADVLPRWVAHYARLRDMAATDLLVEFMRGIHARHLAGHAPVRWWVMCDHRLGDLPCDNPEQHDGGGRGCTHTSTTGSHVNDTSRPDGGHG